MLNYEKLSDKTAKKIEADRKNGDFDQLRVFGSDRMPKFDIDYGTHNGEKSLHIHHFTNGVRSDTPSIIRPDDMLYKKYKSLFKGVK